MTTNYIKVDNFTIQVNTEYVGDTLWKPVGGGIFGNNHNHLVSVYTDEGEAEFQVWGSLARPDSFESDEYGPYDALNLLCREAWDAIEGNIEDLLDPSTYDDPYDYHNDLKKLRSSMEENADKLLNIGLTEDMILKIANSEEDDQYDVVYDDDLGCDVIIPLGY